jgi:predicted alpha/beta superfamily hydrolase
MSQRVSTIQCLLLAAGLLIMPAASPAADVVAPPSHIISGQDLSIRSAVLNEARSLSIYLPDDYHISTARYPVLYVLDGGAYAAYVAETVRLLAFQRDIPPLIVVGIPNTNRVRDFSPFPLANSPGSGGADAFLRFLSEELIPHMDAHYRTETYRILFGHSLGGSFTVYALFAQPTVFQAGLAVSPALYSDRGRLLRHLEGLLASGRGFPTSYLWLSIGDEIAYAESLAYLQAHLEKHQPAGLRWEAHEFLDETHGSIVMRSLDKSLKGLFHDWPLLISEIETGFTAVLQHYQGLAEMLGYELPIPEALVNRLGYRALTADDVTQAIEIFQYNVTAYPASANVYDSLGEALLTNRQLEQAEANYRKSLVLDPQNANARTMLERIDRLQSR